MDALDEGEGEGRKGGEGGGGLAGAGGGGGAEVEAAATGKASSPPFSSSALPADVRPLMSAAVSPSVRERVVESGGSCGALHAVERGAGRRRGRAGGERSWGGARGESQECTEGRGAGGAERRRGGGAER